MPNEPNARNVPRQARYWILTIPEDKWTPPNMCQDPITWLYGQKEEGEGGFRHWQFVCACKKKVTASLLKRLFPNEAHLEISRSDAVEKYVRKEESRIEGSEFEVGQKALKRNSETDWDQVRKLAEEGKMDQIPSDIFIKCHSNLKKIRSDNVQPIYRGKQHAFLFVGPTETGKTRAASSIWPEAHRKSPDNKWWDTYHGQTQIIINEFRGEIPVSKILRWLDREPELVETKFGSCYLNTKVWCFTSNLEIDQWWPLLDQETLLAIKRRFIVHRFHNLEASKQFVQWKGKEWKVDDDEDFDPFQ